MGGTVLAFVLAGVGYFLYKKWRSGKSTTNVVVMNEADIGEQPQSPKITSRGQNEKKTQSTGIIAKVILMMSPKGKKNLS